jgi:hypothetical protein
VQNVHPFFPSHVEFLMGGCNVLLPVCEAFFEALLCLRHVQWVGDFQVATGGGFWVAIGDYKVSRYRLPLFLYTLLWIVPAMLIIKDFGFKRVWIFGGAVYGLLSQQE